MIRRSKTDICSIDVPHDEEYLALVRDLLEHPKVGLMREYIQHGDTTCLEHCVNVSYLSYLFASRTGSTPAPPHAAACCTICSCTTGIFTAAPKASACTDSNTPAKL